jgi:hypothetical protein
MHRLFLAACLTAPLALAPAAGAQASSDLIPRDIVLAILRNAGSQLQGGGEPAIILGDRLPDNLVNKLTLPRGAHVVATLESWSSTDVIGTASAPPDSVRAWFTDELTRRGYEPQDYPGHREAFRPAQGSAIGGFCGAGAYISVSAQQRQPGHTEFVVHARQQPSCSQGQMYGINSAGSTWSSGGINPPALPLLVNPKNSEIAPRCDPRGNGGGSTNTQIGLSTSATPDQLLAHYAKQLDSAGWKRESVAPGVISTWTRRDSAGRDVRVQLTAMANPAVTDCRWLTMTSQSAR